MKTKVHPIIPISILLVCVVLIVFLFKSNLGSNVIVFIPMILLVIVMAIMMLWENNVKDLNPDEIHLESDDGKHFRVTYNDYQVDCILGDILRDIKVPKTDINGKKISNSERASIRNYLMNNYDVLSLPKDIIPVQVSEAKEKLEDLMPCTEDQKKTLSNKNGLKMALPLILLAVLLIPSLFEPSLIKERPMYFIVLLVLAVLLIFGILKRMNAISKDQKDYYCQKVKVFDRKRVEGGDSDTFYYIRVGDDKNHVLMKWFHVSHHTYSNCQTGTLYVSDNNAYFVGDSN